MKKGLTLLAACLITCGVVFGGPSYMFDFDDAPYAGSTAQIETYMEGIYGSDITVDGATIGNGIVPGPLHDYAGDQYMQDTIDLEAGFLISFNDVPITSAQFDWGMRDWFPDQTFNVYGDGVLIYSIDTAHPGLIFNNPDVAVGNTGLLTFETPVTELFIHDGVADELEIDNLQVTAVPAPEAMILTGIGTAIIGWIRKKRAI